MLVIRTAKPRNAERPIDQKEACIAFKLKPEGDRHRTIETDDGLGNLSDALELHGQESPGKADY